MTSTSKICEFVFAPIKLTFISAMVPLLLWGEVGRSSISDWRDGPPVSVKRGDLVFRKDNGVWSKFFVCASRREKRFSHVGIVDADGDDPLIIHANASETTGIGSVRRQRWSGFFSESLDGAVYRFKGTRDERERIALEARSRIGVCFDTGFDMLNTNKLYCTELVREAVNAAARREVIGFTTVADLKKLIAVDDCYKSEMSLVAECDVIKREYEGCFQRKLLCCILCVVLMIAIAVLLMLALRLCKSKES